MIKKIIICFCLLFSIVTFSQEGTSSPYSFYGIGDVRFRGTEEYRSMAGVSVVTDSLHINLQNPAMLANLKLTTFAFGGSFSPNRLKTASQTEKAQRTTFDYLSFAFPVNNIAVGFGLIPYSSVGYNILSYSSDGNIGYSNKGTGGVNKVYTTFAYKINKNLNLGIDFQYNFGKIESTGIVSVKDAQFSTREINASSASGLNVDLGISYQAKLNSKTNIYSSIVYAPKSSLTFSHDRTIASISYSTTGSVSVVGNPISVDIADTKIKMPSKLVLGLGFGSIRKWSFGTEVTTLNNSEFGNRFNDISNSTYENGIKYAFGGYYIPKYNSFSNYFERLTYRGGFRYEKTGLIINSKSITDSALTLGVGFPLNGSFSNINFGMEFGKRGTKDAGLVQENYKSISIGLSFSDKWFQKRKYD